MKRSIIITAIGICLFSFILQSRSSKRDLLIGKWESMDGKETIEFFKDGTVMVISRGLPFGGTYKLIDHSSLRLKVESIFPMVVVMKFSVSRNSLSLTDPYGKTTKYKRVSKLRKKTPSEEIPY